MFATAVKVTVPLPVPVAGTGVSHVAEVEAIQEHPDADGAIATEPPPPAGDSSGFTAERELQAAPACEIMKGWPPTSTFAVRVATVEFGLMAKFTVPKPDPMPPLVTLIHDGPGSVLHEHPPGVIMFTDAVPPRCGNRRAGRGQSKAASAAGLGDGKRLTRNCR